MKHDPVNHPSHYTSHPSGVECITVTEHMSFNVGNAVKYLWRADLKGNAVEDLRKAAFYVSREIERRTAQERAKEPAHPHSEDAGRPMQPTRYETYDTPPLNIDRAQIAAWGASKGEGR